MRDGLAAVPELDAWLAEKSRPRPDRLTQLCAMFADSEFGRRLASDPVNGCIVASTAFVAFVQGFNLPAEVRYLVDSPDFECCAERWMDTEPAGRIHAVVLVAGLLVDWTARQFDPSADFPAITTPRERFGWKRMLPASSPRRVHY